MELTLIRTSQDSFRIDGGRETTSQLLPLAQTQGKRGLKKAKLDPEEAPPFHAPRKDEGYAVLYASYGRKKLELVWGDHYIIHLGTRKGREHQTGTTRKHFQAMLDATTQGDEIVVKVKSLLYVAPGQGTEDADL